MSDDTMNDLLRRAGGRVPKPEPEAPAPTREGRLGGGYRADPPAAGPSFNSLIKASASQRNRDVQRIAQDLDHENRDVS